MIVKTHFDSDTVSSCKAGFTFAGDTANYGGSLSPEASVGQSHGLLSKQRDHAIRHQIVGNN
jgi:hypothetical protein